METVVAAVSRRVMFATYLLLREAEVMSARLGTRISSIAELKTRLQKRPQVIGDDDRVM